MFDNTPVNEASLSRLLTHFNDTGFAIISSDRHELQDKEKQALRTELKSEVRAAGYGYMPLRGYWTETVKDTGEKRQVIEESLFIPNRSIGANRKPLKDVVVELGRKYQQEAVIFKADKGPAELINCKTGEVAMSFKEVHVDKVSDMYSAMRKGSHAGRSIVFESLVYTFRNPQSFNEALYRRSQGEIWEMGEFLKAHKIDVAINRAVDQLLIV